ncbi:TMV resistance protein N-like protein [Tanacetum coccineum]
MNQWSSTKLLIQFLVLNSDIDEGLVGIRACLQDLISQLKIGSGGVRMVGIWGLGGGGKTTLATSVYMEIIRSGVGLDTAYPRDWIRRIEARIRRIFLLDTAYWSSE